LYFSLRRAMAAHTVLVEPDLKLFRSESGHIRWRAAWLQMAGDIIAINQVVACIIDSIVAYFSDIETGRCATTIGILTIDSAIAIFVIASVTHRLPWGPISLVAPRHHAVQFCCGILAHKDIGSRRGHIRAGVSREQGSLIEGRMNGARCIDHWCMVGIVDIAESRKQAVVFRFYAYSRVRDGHR